MTMLKKFEAEHGLPDALSYNLVLGAHAKNGSYKDAGEWILRMEEMGKATVCSPLMAHGGYVMWVCKDVCSNKSSLYWMFQSYVC